MNIITENERWARFVTPGDPDECWEWQGWRSPQGYGRFNIGGKQIPANRAAAIREGMDVRPGLDVCHTCDNPPCVNPAHIYVGTRSQNIQDCADRGRHPKQGLGERDWSAKYSDAEVADWKTRHAAGESFHSIARLYNAHMSTISRTVRGIQRRTQNV
ncbi:HNH endonuclease [Glaciihabitans sp. UYNi722]|uniref:HNH endonuclease n=1 Tax=Glaciihabitans sp. UYNi722 TaxID=3156344 RepID=UPI003397CF27